MPPEHHKTIAQHIAAVWESRVRIIEMTAKGTAHVQAMAQLTDFPSPGTTSYATVGLSDHGGLELATLAPARYKSIAKALFDVASYVAGGRRTLRPGETFEKVVARYYTKLDVGHWFIRAEAPPGLAIPPVFVPKREVAWTYAWPITSDELVWRQAVTKHQLAPHLDAAGIRAFDLGRSTVAGIPAFHP
jgi:hypothetical protein